MVERDSSVRWGAYRADHIQLALPQRLARQVIAAQQRRIVCLPSIQRCAAGYPPLSADTRCMGPRQCISAVTGLTQVSERTAAPGVLGRRGRAIGVQARGGRAEQVGVAARAAEQGQQVAAVAARLQLVQHALALFGAQPHGCPREPQKRCAVTAYKLAIVAVPG